MSVEEMVAVGGLALAIVSAGIRALWVVFDRLSAIAKRQGQIEFMAQETWNAIMRRAFADGVIHGTITMIEAQHKPNEPYQINQAARDWMPYKVKEEAKEWLNSIAPILKDAYMREWSGLDDNRLALAIESRFGERIMREVCIPRNMTNLQCLLIACAVARGD